MGKIVFLRNHPNKAAYRGTKKSRGFIREIFYNSSMEATAGYVRADRRL